MPQDGFIDFGGHRDDVWNCKGCKVSVHVMLGLLGCLTGRKGDSMGQIDGLEEKPAEVLDSAL